MDDLYIYLVERIHPEKGHLIREYDEYDSMIVIARSEESAKAMRPNDEFQGGWSRDINELQVELIGIALPGETERVVLASFNAG